MFEVGFGEILMLALVTLIVVGPEQLPKVARTAGLWIGKARRMVASVRADIERELRAEEMKEFLNTRDLTRPLEELVEDGRNAMHNAQQISSANTVSSVTPTSSAQSSSLQDSASSKR